MTDPIRALLDGLSVAGSHWQLVAAILLVLVLSQILLNWVLRSTFGDKLTAGESYSLSLAGWLLPATLVSLLWYGGAEAISPEASTLAVAAVFLAGVTLSVRASKRAAGTSEGIVSPLLLLAGFFILLRLAFVSKAVLPMYFDSAQHYHFIARILAGLETPALDIRSLVQYYHLGFHILTAFLTFITRAEIPDTMLALGQVILAIMPFSTFFIVRYWTQSDLAGLTALFLAAFGWYMPAHAMDWGKYPALAGLALIPFVLSLTYLVFQRGTSLTRRNFWTLMALLLAGVSVSVFLHSRSLIVIAIAALSWLGTWAWMKLTRPARLALLGAGLLAIVVEIVFIRTMGILGPLLDSYGRDSLLITSCVLILAIFAYRPYPGLVFFCTFSTSLLLASLFIPLVNLIPGFASTTLLDRPFVQMSLHLPLALLGGFGLAGLEQRLQGREYLLRHLPLGPGKLAGVLFILLVAIHALFKYDLYPSDCCVIVSEDDLAAIRWLDENLPGQATILTASTELKVLPTDEYQGSAGSDGGAWITPLTGRASAFMPFNTDFSSQETLEALCGMQVDYVYVGGTGYYFDDAGMPVQPDGYRIVFALPKAKMYEVTGCD